MGRSTDSLDWNKGRNKLFPDGLLDLRCRSIHKKQKTKTVFKVELELTEIQAAFLVFYHLLVDFFVIIAA